MSSDPGYGPNGERLDPSGAISWAAAADPRPATQGWEFWMTFPLGLITIPFSSQTDDNVWSGKYLGAP